MIFLCDSSKQFKKQKINTRNIEIILNIDLIEKNEKNSIIVKRKK
jgi:hypothetical protein